MTQIFLVDHIANGDSGQIHSAVENKSSTPHGAETCQLLKLSAEFVIIDVSSFSGSAAVVVLRRVEGGPITRGSAGQSAEPAGLGEANDAAPNTRTHRHLVPHAAARLARVVVQVVGAESDPHTLSSWSQIVFVAPGTLRNWCRTAGVRARQCLVFARLLRVLFASRTGAYRPENLLDVADSRTLTSLARVAGFASWDDLPRELELFLDRQRLICDRSIIEETRAALGARGF